jgi:hypothetical protein
MFNGTPNALTSRTCTISQVDGVVIEVWYRENHSFHRFYIDYHFIFNSPCTNVFRLLGNFNVCVFRHQRICINGVFSETFISDKNPESLCVQCITLVQCPR